MMTQENSKTGSKKRLSLLWRMLEAWFQRVYRLEPLNSEPNCLIAFNLYAHQGEPVTLQDATTLRARDTVLEIHFRREALLPLIQDGSPVRMGIRLLRLGDRDIPRLAQRLATDPALAEVRALHALTLFHRGIERFGFEVLSVKERHVEWWFTQWHRLLMARDHAEGWKHVKAHREQLVTRHIWISREEFLRRHLPQGEV
jgi:hypothetical protein